MFWRRWRAREHDLERELRTDMELEAEEQHEHGLSAEEARYAANRAFGNTTLVKEEVREMWGWTILEQVAQDTRHALRGMRKNPGFTLVATLSLALSIGATTAVFSVLNAVVLRPLRVTAPERLVVLQPQLRGERFVLFNPVFEELRRRQQSLTGMFAVSDEPYLKVALGREAPAYLRSSLVSGNYFEVLGLSPALGRLLAQSDDQTSPATCAAVISYAFWTDRFHRDPAALGYEMRIGEKECTIVGVAPAGFRSHESG
ncbi:MAG: ABC transporter permease, partial [Bryobacteraceae bacterium]